MFLTVSLMLRTLGFAKEAEQVSDAVCRVVKAEKNVTYDLGGTSTTIEMAAEIKRSISKPEVTKKTQSHYRKDALWQKS